MKIRLTLIVTLLVFGIQGIGCSQVFKPSEESSRRSLASNTKENGLEVEIPVRITTATFDPKLTVDEIYDKTIRSLIWVVTEIGQGSGVLIDEKLRLVVTNHHVTKDSDSIVVFFPVRDKDGIWIDERDFYTNESNIDLLERLGYAISGRIIAKEPKTDLVIVQLSGLPDTAREIEHDFSYPHHLHMNNNDKVQIFGNPGDLKLWRWTAGFFQTVNRGMIQIEADIYKGNSGGPVLNDEGILIGIATLSNERTRTWAIAATSIKDLLSTLEPRQIFSITNNTLFTIPYEVKWGEFNPWGRNVLKPGLVWIHWVIGSSGNIAEGYPKIRFDYIVNDEEFTPSIYDLQTYTQHFGSGVQPTDRQDGREYHFSYNSYTRRLGLRDSEKKWLKSSN